MVYNGTWVEGGTPHEYNNTVSSSTNVGDSFTVTFQGASIAVYGTMDATSGGVITSYSIDGASSSNVTTQAGLGDTYHQQFWSSEQFPVAVHRLRVTMVKVNNVTQSGEGTIWFDYFLVRDPTVVTYPTTSSAPLTPTTSPISNSRQSTPIGSIVGGALGGLSLLLVAIFLLVLYRRGHTKLSPKKIYNTLPPGDFGTKNTSIQPYLLGNREISENASSSKVVPTMMVSREHTAPDLKGRGYPHTRATLPTTTTISGKHTPGNEDSGVDRQAQNANTPQPLLQRSDDPQRREEVISATLNRIPDASAELPPGYSSLSFSPLR